jgi:AcrR family transcriptional regulator
VDGLEGLSIGNLADALEMSKSGRYAHFGSKQELQLATVDEAGRIFQLEDLERRTSPRRVLLRRGGAGDGHPARPGQGPGGRLPDGVPPAPAAAGGRSRAGRGPGRRRGPGGLALELNGITLAADSNVVLHDDPGALAIARKVVRRRLGVSA